MQFRRRDRKHGPIRTTDCNIAYWRPPGPAMAAATSPATIIGQTQCANTLEIITPDT